MSAYRRCRTGTDPEFFFVDKEGEVVPAELILPWKEDPLIVVKRREYHSPQSKSVGASLHADGIPGEITIGEGHCRAYLIDQTYYALKKALELAEAKGYTLSFEAGLPVSEKTLEQTSEKGKLFGCDVEYIAWLNGAPSDLNVDSNHPYRYSGGHIHIGKMGHISHTRTGQQLGYLYDNNFQPDPAKYTSDSILDDKKIDLVKLNDIILGNTLVLLDQREGSTLRKKHYGKAGAYRPTDYGIEYRVPSNIIINNPFYLYLAFALARDTVRIMMLGREKEFFSLFEGESLGDLILAINNNDKSLAAKNWNKVKSLLNDTKGENYDAMLIDYFSIHPDFYGDPITAWKLRDRLSPNHGSGLPDIERTYETLRRKKSFSDFKTGYNINEAYV